MDAQPFPNIPSISYLIRDDIRHICAHAQSLTHTRTHTVREKEREREMQKTQTHTHTQREKERERCRTHTHTYTYRERERERVTRYSLTMNTYQKSKNFFVTDQWSHGTNKFVFLPKWRHWHRKGQHIVSLSPLHPPSLTQEPDINSPTKYQELPAVYMS